MCMNCKGSPDVQWSWSKFWIGKLSNKLFAWVLSTALVYLTLFGAKLHNESSEKIILIIWGPYR